MLNAHYVILELTVWESDRNQALNTPGAEDLMRAGWGGKSIPFIAVSLWGGPRGLHSETSKELTGYPGRNESIRAFGLALDAHRAAHDTD